MAYTTTFTCDQCGKTAIDDQRFLTLIRVQLESPYTARGDGFKDSNAPQASWCEECLVRFGLKHVGNTLLPAAIAPEVPPTLEEVIRAIVREEIKAAQ